MSARWAGIGTDPNHPVLAVAVETGRTLVSSSNSCSSGARQTEQITLSAALLLHFHGQPLGHRCRPHTPAQPIQWHALILARSNAAGAGRFAAHNWSHKNTRAGLPENRLSRFCHTFVRTAPQFERCGKSRLEGGGRFRRSLEPEGLTRTTQAERSKPGKIQARKAVRAEDMARTLLPGLHRLRIMALPVPRLLPIRSTAPSCGLGLSTARWCSPLGLPFVLLVWAALRTGGAIGCRLILMTLYWKVAQHCWAITGAAAGRRQAASALRLACWPSCCGGSVWSGWIQRRELADLPPWRPLAPLTVRTWPLGAQALLACWGRPLSASALSCLWGNWIVPSARSAGSRHPRGSTPGRQGFRLRSSGRSHCGPSRRSFGYVALVPMRWVCPAVAAGCASPAKAGWLGEF